jgi:uncharacterized protein YyaL (SSP411 family)
VRNNNFVKPEDVIYKHVPEAQDTLPVPTGWSRFYERSGRPYYTHSNKITSKQYELPSSEAIDSQTIKKEVLKMDVESIIARAQAETNAALAKDLEEKKKLKEAEDEKKGLAKKVRKEGGKDKKVMTLFSAIVIGVMSKHRSNLGDSDNFKKRAKEVRSCIFFMYDPSLTLFGLSC